MKTTPQTTAQHLLDLIFENHTIRYSLDEHGNPLFVSKDVCAALGLKSERDAFRSLEKNQRGGVLNPTPGGTQKLRAVTQSGLLMLTIKSRKPSAKRFQAWIVDEVLPQLIRYGSYIPGATPAERCRNLYHRWKAERAEEVQHASTELAESGLLTIGQFMKLADFPARDSLAFSNIVRKAARDYGQDEPCYYYLNGRMTPAWSHGWTPATTLPDADTSVTVFTERGTIHQAGYDNESGYWHETFTGDTVPNVSHWKDIVFPGEELTTTNLQKAAERALQPTR